MALSLKAPENNRSKFLFREGETLIEGQFNINKRKQLLLSKITFPLQSCAVL